MRPHVRLYRVSYRLHNRWHEQWTADIATARQLAENPQHTDYEIAEITLEEHLTPQIMLMRVLNGETWWKSSRTLAKPK